MTIDYLKSLINEECFQAEYERLKDILCEEDIIEIEMARNKLLLEGE